MATLQVLEYVRSRDGFWDLPRSFTQALRPRFAGVEWLLPDTQAQADALLPQADVVFGHCVTSANLASATRLRWIHSPAAGVDHVLFPALAESAVVLTNARGMHADGMAEHAIGVMLTFARKLHWSRDAQGERRWSQREQWTQAPLVESLAGQTLGLVGFGRVGQAIAQRAKAMGMRVLAVRRHPAHPGGSPAPADAQWGLERLGDLMGESDWVVLVAPQTTATQHLIGASEFARMKPSARLMNLGRGALVDDAALLAALQEQRIAGAALDVFGMEPLPAEHPYWDMREVFLTPHTSGLGPQYWERAIEIFAANLERFVAGAPLENVVDKQAGY
jgi:phosphoglycerate dehydrogenase-like enzyme